MQLIAKQGGMATTSNFKVTFDANAFLDLVESTEDGEDTPLDQLTRDTIEFFCDEAQLPSLQIATGEIVGRHLGRGTEYYATSKLNSDFSLGFVCDRNMSQYKFLTRWYQFAMGMDINTTDRSSSGFNDTYRIRYPENYMMSISIEKREKDRISDQNFRSIKYDMQKCFPYAIDAVPLSAGTSQLVKVNAQFYYRKFNIIHDTKNIIERDPTLGAPDLTVNPTSTIPVA